VVRRKAINHLYWRGPDRRTVGQSVSIYLGLMTSELALDADESIAKQYI